MSPAAVQVVRALAATLAVQAMVTMATLTVPVFAPEAAGDIGLDAANIGNLRIPGLFGRDDGVAAERRDRPALRSDPHEARRGS